MVRMRERGRGRKGESSGEVEVAEVMAVSLRKLEEAAAKSWTVAQLEESLGKVRAGMGQRERERGTEKKSG